MAPTAEKTRTRSQRPKGQPDGLPPGQVEILDPPDKHAFDADARATTREAAIITVGEQQFYRRRKNWTVTRELRVLLTKQERAMSKQQRLRAQIDALTEQIRGLQDPKTGEWTTPPMTDEDAIADVERKVDALQEQTDTAGDASDEASYEIIALLLRDDQGAHPDTGHLKEHLDSEDVVPLAAKLAGGGETVDESDPTAETTDS